MARFQHSPRRRRARDAALDPLLLRQQATAGAAAPTAVRIGDAVVPVHDAFQLFLPRHPLDPLPPWAPGEGQGSGGGGVGNNPHQWSTRRFVEVYQQSENHHFPHITLRSYGSKSYGFVPSKSRRKVGVVFPTKYSIFWTPTK